VERAIAEAKLGRVRPESVNREAASEREAYAEALRRRADLVAAGASQDDLDIVADNLSDGYAQDEDGPLGVPATVRHTINLLRDVPGQITAPEPTLRDALRLYLKEHLRADDPSTDSRVVSLATRVVEAAISSIGRDAKLSSLTREYARVARDHMLDRVKDTGIGVAGKVSVATVSRELSIITAVINFAKVEFGLPDTVQNPFSRLPLERVAKGQGRKASEKRDHLPPEVLSEVRTRVLSKASPELARIWRLIEGSGCRIAEVTALRVEDMRVADDLPFMSIEPHSLRSLKTESSRRQVPLVGDALVAAKEAVKLAGEGLVLFPSYGRLRSGDAASASLMKHVRRVSVDEKHVIHSLRHNMKDRLIGPTPLEQDLILGHALEGVGNKVYGGAVAKLKTTTRAMQRAFGLPLNPE
jgi:integrase